MDIENRKSCNYKYLALAAAAAGVLALAGIMQLNIPRDKNPVPENYTGNMLVAADELCNAVYLGTPQAYEYLQQALRLGMFYDELRIWQNWHQNGKNHK